MKTRAALILWLALWLLALPLAAEAQQAGRIAGRRFVVQQLTETGIPWTPLTMFGHPLHLTFQAEAPRFLASTGCNTLMGDYTIVGGKSVVARAGSTLMACINAKARDLEILMEAFLRSSPSLSLDGDRLVLESSRVRLEALDSRVANPDRPLIGTNWQYSSELQSGGGESGELGLAAIPTLVLASDGTFIYQGCRRIIGRYEQAADRITLRPGPEPGSTCSDTRAAELDRRIIGRLRDSALTAAITGESLRLVRDDGAGVTFREFAAAPLSRE